MKASTMSREKLMHKSTSAGCNWQYRVLKQKALLREWQSSGSMSPRLRGSLSDCYLQTRLRQNSRGKSNCCPKARTCQEAYSFDTANLRAPAYSKHIKRSQYYRYQRPYCRKAISKYLSPV